MSEANALADDDVVRDGVTFVVARVTLAGKLVNTAVVLSNALVSWLVADGSAVISVVVVIVVTMVFAGAVGIAALTGVVDTTVLTGVVITTVFTGVVVVTVLTGAIDTTVLTVVTVVGFVVPASVVVKIVVGSVDVKGTLVWMVVRPVEGHISVLLGVHVANGGCCTA